MDDLENPVAKRKTVVDGPCGLGLSLSVCELQHCIFISNESVAQNRFRLYSGVNLLARYILSCRKIFS